jgi:hypothetical protein
MAQFNLENYEPVEERIRRFWEQYPEGRIITDVVQLTETGGVFKASIFTDREDERPVTVDYAEEVKGSSPVNRTSWVENGLTSAIGRALADLGFSPKGSRPSREEMQKVQRGNVAKVAKVDPSEILAEVASAKSREELDKIWVKFAGVADVEFLDESGNTVTAKSVMMARAKELGVAK